ncbi:hypothetical protein [Paenibacillus campi]|uniref:hypothetical protein n=1 Tax=Paenibacillus campi TaxID=3106031 RepID=UPI002AFF796B|nr:hypothetical protein [Paenibacillus sp. SGZ-1009]
MKKVLLAVSASALALSLAGVTVIASPSKASAYTAEAAAENATIKITYVPAAVTGLPPAAQPSLGGINAQAQNITLKGIGSKYVMTNGSKYVMTNGSNWLIWSGSDVVKLSGATITTIGYGDATVYAYKGNGQLLGAYYISVIR